MGGEYVLGDQTHQCTYTNVTQSVSDIRVSCSLYAEMTSICGDTG